VINILKASAMNAEIKRVMEKIFELANSTPIQHMSLQQLVGFCASTTYTKVLLQGKLAIPTNIDEATTELIQEMQQLWTRIWPFHGYTKIMPEVYKYYWGGVNESISLALSKIHFGHWKAWRLSLELTKVACSHLNLIALTGLPPLRWGNGLQVLLEKVLGVALVDKLRAILLIEGNFNFFNKWLFGHVAVNKLYKLGYIRKDQYSKKGSTAEDSKLENRLTMDLSCQLCQPLIAVSANADKCYNQINHIIMSLLLLAIGGEDGPISAMFRPIQQMRFFQRTGRGDSDMFMGGRPSCNSLQGLWQGNGVAPACWIMLSSLMMSVYRQGGHMSTMVSPISGDVIEFMGDIYMLMTPISSHSPWRSVTSEQF
jgi:hypothetical protein